MLCCYYVICNSAHSNYILTHFRNICDSNTPHYLCRILSVPKARSILLNGAVRKGERLVPPVSFDLFMRATFPVSSARVKVCSLIYASFY
jgi:hypothetical protein